MPDRAEIASKINLVVALLLSLVATIFLVIAYINWRKSARITQFGIKTEGTVVEMHRRPRKIGEPQPVSEAPVIEFYTEKGEKTRYYSTLYSSAWRPQIGDKTEIWYLPDNPQEATTGGADAWLLPGIFGGFGLIAALIGFPMLLGIMMNNR